MRVGLRNTVRATTREEVDLALRSADRVVVEGEDALIAYAIAEVSQQSPDPPRPKMSLEPPGRVEAPPSPAYARTPTPRVGPAPARRRMFPWVAVAMVGILVAVGLVLFLFLKPQAPPGPRPVVSRPAEVGAGGKGPQTSVNPLTADSATAPPSSAPGPPTAPTTAPDLPAPGPGAAAAAAPDRGLAASLAWPAVAIVALVTMFLLARQAIAGGSDVKVEWKVTEKVSGRLVITKVVRRPARKPRMLQNTA